MASPFDALDAIIAGLPAEPQPQGRAPDVAGRYKKNLANLPVNILEGLSNTAFHAVNPIGYEDDHQRVEIPNFFDQDAPVSTGEGIADMLTGKEGIASQLLQSLPAAGLAGAAAKGLGFTGAGAEAIKWAGGFAGPELQREGATGTDALVAGALGAATGPTMAMDRLARLKYILPIAGAHAAYEGSERGPMAGGIAGAVDLGSNLIFGAHTNAETPKLEASPQQVVADSGTPSIVQNLAQKKPQFEAVDENWAGPINQENPSNSAAAYQRYKQQLLEAQGRPSAQPKSGVAFGGPDRVEAPILPSDGFATLQTETLNPQPPFPVDAWHGPVFSSEGDPQSALQGEALRQSLFESQVEPSLIDPRSGLPSRETPGQVEAPIVPETAITPSPMVVEDATTNLQFHLDRFSHYNPAELKGFMRDLDNDIANTLEPEALNDFKTARQAVEQLLESKEVKPKPIIEAPREVTKSTNPIVEHPDEIPELATLQRVRQKVKFTEEDADVVSKWLSGEDIPDVEEIPDDLKGQDFSFESRVGTREGVKLAEHSGVLPAPAIKAVDKIVDAVKAATNKHISIKFKSGAHFSDDAVAGQALWSGDVELNVDKLVQKLGDWNTMGEKDKAKMLYQFSNIVGHEVSHTALNLVGNKNPALFKKLLNEFEALGEEGRLAIIQDYHKSLGLKDPIGSMYAAGNQAEMIASYGIHPENTNQLAHQGLHEFFAEMGAAHIFGKLREELLPPEMRSLWQKFKDFLSAAYDRLFKTVDIDNVDHPEIYQNFKELVEEVHDRFSTFSEANIREAGKISETKNSRLWDKFKAENRRLEELETVNREKASAYGIEEEGIYALAGDKFATLQGRFNAPPGGMNRPIVGNRAFIEAQMLRHLGMGIGGAVAGGYLGPKLSNGQITVAEGVFAGAVLGFAGPIVLKRLFMTMPKQGAATFHHVSAKEAFKMLFTSEGLRTLGGDASNGQGSAPAKFVRFLERNLNLHLPKNLFNAVIESEGPASYAVQIAQDAFSKARTFETTPVIDAAVMEYLGGRSDVAELRRVLGSNADAQNFANFIVTGRESIGLLQEMFQSGLSEGSFKRQIVASLQKGDYLTRQYRMFHDPDYKPDQTQIEALALELSSAHPEYDLSTARIHVEDYLHQIEIERGQFSGGKGDVGQKLDSVLFQRKNDTLGAAFRDALGEYRDPKEKIMGTIRHLYTNAISSKFYDHVSTMTDSNGLKMSYTLEEHATTIQSIEAKLRHPPAGITQEEIATLQKQKQQLQYFVPLERATRYGKLAGKVVNRFVRDQLASFDSPWGLMDGSIMRSMSKFHNWIKVGRTAMNPITVVRNMVSAPILMGLAKANPFKYGATAISAMKDLSTGIGREMLEHGIYGVDQVKGELFRVSEQILMGDYDHKGLEGIFKTGMNKVLEFYRMPDMLVRGVTYLTAKGRFARDFNLPETDKRVIDAARDWTNRYTVNYANVAPLVRSLRQVPFTNLFISYTAEVTRIAKNLVEDIFTHPNAGQRVWAAGAIGGLAAVPVMMEKAGIANLSPKDQEEWKKSQAQLPDYSRNRFRIVLGKENGRFRYLDVTPLLQIDSLLQMMRSTGVGDWKALLATNPIFGWDNTPLLNIAAEQIAGKDLRTQRPLDTPVKRLQEAVKEVVPPILPGGYEWQRGKEAFSETDSGERGITNLRSGRRTTPGEIVTSYLTGMRMSTVDTTYLHRNVVSDAKRQIANEASYYRDVAQTNLPQVAKDKAAARYKQAVQGILQDMRTRLSGEVP